MDQGEEPSHDCLRNRLFIGITHALGVSTIDCVDNMYLKKKKNTADPSPGAVRAVMCSNSSFCCP